MLFVCKNSSTHSYMCLFHSWALDAKTKKFGFLKKKKMGNAYYCPSSVWLSF
jgi:hypothetical protein